MAQWFLLPVAAAMQMSSLAAATAAACFGVAVLARRGAIPPAASHPVGAGIAFLICANSLYRVYFLADPHQTTWLVLLVVGAGCLFVSVNWMLAVVAFAHLGWWSIALAVSPERAWKHFGLSLIAATALAWGVSVMSLAAIGVEGGKNPTVEGLAGAGVSPER